MTRADEKQENPPPPHHQKQQQQHVSNRMSVVVGESNASGRLASKDVLFNLLQETLPLDQVALAFGYGSGVFSQKQHLEKDDTDTKMIDFVIAVKDSYRFHKENLERNPHHYKSNSIAMMMMSPFARDRATRVDWWQRHHIHNCLFSNPGLYYNVTDQMKYGVVHVDDLAADLKDWKYLYLAGRMHKPIAIILNQQHQQGNDDDGHSLMYLQQRYNLPAALSTALLLLSNSVKTDSNTLHVDAPVLFEAIASLSYTGDPRMAAGAEDPNKVTKLVNSSGQLERFQELYKPALDTLHAEGVISVADQINSVSWNANCTTTRERLWKNLPCNLQQLHSKQRSSSVSVLQDAIPKIVAPAARYQSMKGLVTAGVTKSAFYAMRKLSKGVLSKR